MFCNYVCTIKKNKHTWLIKQNISDIITLKPEITSYCDLLQSSFDNSKTWFSRIVSMMSGEGTVLPPGPIIKKEVEASSFQACSPSNSNMYSPTTTVMHSDMEYCESQDSKRYEVPQARSPGSPDQQYCSSTTQSLGDSMLGHPETSFDYPVFAKNKKRKNLQKRSRPPSKVN
uniref:Uncharacterized protein n=1 Tax=Timema poppense TaxID=170557 RepID=A0A7R9H5I4_TIMPO|nr:unnamed protein product [Timema poppensis]